MSQQTPAYEALTPESLPRRLGPVAALASRVGHPSAWMVREVGDGNLNLVFIVEGPRGGVVVKQALPYVRLVGDSWPLPLYRSTFEYHALTRQHARDPGRVPQVLHFDEAQAILVMDLLAPHRILRQKLIAGERVEGLGAALGAFCARTAFRGSELSMASDLKKAEVALFAGNVAIPAITEAPVFTDPYYDAPMNRHSAGLEPVVAALRANVPLKVKVQRMLQRFASSSETMLHGDLHSGSIMATDTDSRVIDPEFSQYGPMGFDIGMLDDRFYNVLTIVQKSSDSTCDVVPQQSYYETQWSHTPAATQTAEFDHEPQGTKADKLLRLTARWKPAPTK